MLFTDARLGEFANAGPDYEAEFFLIMKQSS